MIRQKAVEHQVLFYDFVQAVGTNGTSASELDWRTPNVSEMRWLAYHTLAYGARGLLWFHWDAEDWGVIQNPDRDNIYTSLQEVNQEIKSLGDVMTELRTVDVYQVEGQEVSGQTGEDDDKSIHPGDNYTNLTVGMFSANDAKEYFMLTNTSYTIPVDSEIRILKAINNLEVFNLETKAWEALSINTNSVIVIWCLGAEVQASVVFNGNFETGDYSQWDELEWNTSCPEAEQFEIVTSPKREGQYSAKMTVHDGDEFESTGGERVQLERPKLTMRMMEMSIGILGQPIFLVIGKI